MKTKYIVFLIAIVVASPICSQIEYKTNRLCSISELLCLDIPDSLMIKDSIFFGDFNGLPFVVRIKDKRVEHIGKSLLTLDQRKILRSPALDFLERYFLELAIHLDTLWRTSKRMKIDKVSFTKGNISFLSLLPDSTYSIEIQSKNGHDYIIQWSKENHIFCRIEFPMHYDLISGQDKEECENRFFHEIERDTMAYVFNKIISPELLLLDSLEGYYVRKGVNYYIPELNDNQYFTMDSTNNLKPYYEPLHIVETLSNLFTMPNFKNDYILDITMFKTGYKSESFHIPLSEWSKHFARQGFDIYFGIMELGYPFVDCLIIICNKEMCFEHSLIVHLDVETLYELKGIIKAELRSYRMTSRIKSLFKEFNI